MEAYSSQSVLRLSGLEIWTSLGCVSIDRPGLEYPNVVSVGSQRLSFIFPRRSLAGIPGRDEVPERTRGAENIFPRARPA
jgi:hypothetical protein